MSASEAVDPQARHAHLAAVYFLKGDVMKKLLVIALSCFLSSNGVYAADSSCKVQAAEKKLSGAAKNSFVKKCEKDTAAK